MGDRYRDALRNTNRRARSELSYTFQLEASNKICAKIRELDSYRYAKRIAFYYPINGEIDLVSLWRSAPLQGKHCYFPVIKDTGSLLFLPANPNTPFIENRYGIEEPDVDRGLALEPQYFNIIFIPVVAFDERGYRIGVGAGSYDKTLASLEGPLRIGVAYEFQRTSFIAPKPWDIPLDLVITEEKIYRRHGE